MLGQPVTQELRVHQIPSRGVVPLELVHIFVAGLLPPLMCGRSSDSSHIKFEVLADACSNQSGWIVMFRKALPAKFIVRIMPENCWIRWFRSCAPMFLSDRLVSDGALRSSAGY
jgi:hypothetical protein